MKASTHGLGAVRSRAGQVMRGVGALAHETPRGKDVCWPLAVGALFRAAMVGWAEGRFPPAEDGHYYHIFADRLARGLGYTWLWADGTVTSAAHYPVGYPAMIAPFYALLGANPWVAMGLNAALGCLAIVAVHRIAASQASRLGALAAAWLIALDPGLVAYTPAIMTEGVTAALLALAGWMVVVAQGSVRYSAGAARWGIGLLLGVAALVRPQVLLLAPALGALAIPSERAAASNAWRPRMATGMVALLLAVGVCVPWTVRNCSQMGQCVFGSANGGWNLLIGAGEGATGGWVPIEVAGLPEECRPVYDEAGKDRCFGRAAVRIIGNDPTHWLALVPKKLSATFDFGDAAGWYLRASNPLEFSEAAHLSLAGLEILWHRAVLLVAVMAALMVPGPRRALRAVGALWCAYWLFAHSAWLSYLGLVLIVLALGRVGPRHAPAMLAAIAVLGTAMTHAMFFGASRYSMVCFTLMGALAGCVFIRPRTAPGGPPAGG